MNIEEIAARFDNRVGYRLIAYGTVGLPVFRLTTIGLCLIKKDLDPIEEFVLRSIATGIESPEEITGLLGLENAVIESCLSELIRVECLRVVSDSSTPKKKIVLTSKGKEIAQQHETIMPLEQAVVFCVDGLTRKPSFYPSENLLKPRDLKEEGIPEVRAFPSKPPDLNEIDIKDIIDVVRLDTGRAESPRQLLQISSIERRDRVFLDAVALAYRTELGGDIQVDFAIDGRLSREHGQAFARAKGIEKTKLFRGLLESPYTPSMTEILGEHLSKQVEEAVKDQCNPNALQQKARVAKAKIYKTQINVIEASSPEDTQKAKQEDDKAKEDLLHIKDEIESIQVRPLAVYEHTALLKDAIEHAEKRILIISPWIRRAVVNTNFLKSLRKALHRGVTIYIGYGLGNDDEDGNEWDIQARQELEKLVTTSERFFLKRTGDTHAKVLIKDSEYFVITSFNWLSFKGDPHRTFREEWGTVVYIPSIVEDYFNKMVARFEGTDVDNP